MIMINFRWIIPRQQQPHERHNNNPIQSKFAVRFKKLSCGKYFRNTMKVLIKPQEFLPLNSRPRHQQDNFPRDNLQGISRQALFCLHQLLTAALETSSTRILFTFKSFLEEKSWNIPQQNIPSPPDCCIAQLTFLLSSPFLVLEVFICILFLHLCFF